MSRKRASKTGREVARLFELGGYWLSREERSPFIYRNWYDPVARKTRRVSTGSRDLEIAKTDLAKLVLSEPGEDPLNPKLVALASVKKFYFEHHADEKVRSIAAARRAFALVSKYLRETLEHDDAAKVADFSLARQEGFMIWCRDKFRLSGKTISTYLSTIKAAFRFAAKPRIIRDARGREREARLLEVAPFVEDSEEAVTRVTGLERSTPRKWIPTDAELAAVIDAITEEHAFRYVICALNTWARPEAITELRVKVQVDFARELVHLNPPGRVQNKKVRPTIRLTKNLSGWLSYWNLDQPIVRNGRPVAAVDNRTLRKAAKAAKVPDWENFTRYTLRHYMATRCRRVEGIEVTREQRAEWMGHTDPNHRTTQGWYESLDPDHLVNCAQATDAILSALDRLTAKNLVSPDLHPTDNVLPLIRKGK